MKLKIIFTFLTLALLLSCKEATNNLPDGLYAQIETNKGNIIVQLEYEKAPITVANFVSLAEGKNEFITNENLKNKPFYDGLKFHRVIDDFMIQGGDPLGTGSGDTGYKFIDEINEMRFDKGGVLAMANSGPATNSSQFFITHLETPWLDGLHTIFGHVAQGMEVVNLIKQDDTIKKISIIRNGEAAKKFDAVRTFRDYFKEESVNKNKKQAEDALLESQYKVIREEKANYFSALKAKSTKSVTGLNYLITQKGSSKKPANGTNVNINYSGFLENGSLFDSSIEEVSRAFGKYDANRAAQNGYQPIPFVMGTKQGMIPGFIEGIEKLCFGDKAVIFIPSKLGYGEAGAGNVIPPNATIIFEIELVEKQSK